MIPIGRPSEAIDPIGLFVAFIIIVNVISAFARRARAQRTTAQAQAQTQTTQQPQSFRLEDAMRKAAADASATRQVQRVRMEQAIRAAQARMQQQMAASQPVTLTQVPPPLLSSVQAATPPAAVMALPQTEALPSFDYAQGMLQAMPTLSTAAAVPPLALPILGSTFTGPQLFVAAAIVGPPAALRSVGHTPAGW